MNFDGMILKLVYELHGYGILLYVIITSITAAALSFAVGTERLFRGKTASIKTHVLLSVGCSLLMTISIWAIRIADGSLSIMSGPGSLNKELTYDTSRIAAAVITGMGFLGAGAIIKDRFSVHGLSTATTLWISAAIGLACGSGFVLESVAFTAIVVIILISINGINAAIEQHSPCIIASADNTFPLIKTVNAVADENGVYLKKVKVIEVGAKRTRVKVLFPYRSSEQTVLYMKNQLENIEGMTIEKTAKK